MRTGRPRQHPLVTVHCQKCNSAFTVGSDRISTGRGKYCSKACQDKDKDTRVERFCEYCNNPFLISPESTQRFCSKSCWYAWHTGPNNKQSNRIITTCHHCGKELRRIPFRMKSYDFQYCSHKCAVAEHGKKITAEKHPNWHGGSLNGRGPSWEKTKRAVIESQHNKCLDCGMTNDEHRAKYHKNLNVHHRTPYRLTLDNSDDNLVALCISCHAREEAEIRHNLTYDELSEMRRRTLERKALGLDIEDKSRHKDDCPGCGNPKEKRANLCKKCFALSRRKH